MSARFRLAVVYQAYANPEKRIVVVRRDLTTERCYVKSSWSHCGEICEHLMLVIFPGGKKKAIDTIFGDSRPAT
jgi:hypothetical protein